MTGSGHHGTVLSLPTISVVAAVHNGLATLDRAIRSVLSQAFVSWELLLVDDGSTDGTYAALLRWAEREPRIRVIQMPENCGPGAARNAGLQAARGEFVTYLDHDDEYYPDYLEHLARLAQSGNHDVLVFAYDVVEDGGSRVHTWEPARAQRSLFASNLATPLGVAHRRDLIGRVGGFNELLWREEDWDLWKRLARAGIEFTFVGAKSGRYHVRPDSRSRAPHVTARQRRALLDNWQAGRPLFAQPGVHLSRRKVRRIAFASPHSVVDFASGAAVATAQAMQLLAKCGFDCEVFCGTRLDAAGEGGVEKLLQDAASPYQIRTARIRGHHGRTAVTTLDQVPVTLFGMTSPGSPRSPRDEAAAFLVALGEFLDDSRPNALITYGGDPLSQGVIAQVKARDIPIVFALHNFAYPDPRAFANVDYVVVPSQFSRQYHWNHLGLACHFLPNVIDPRRVLAENRKPECVTFVNPQATKGAFVFAAIADALARRRPDIPLLVVEGRQRSSSLRHTGLDLAAMGNVELMPNAADPRRFYAGSKLLLMPSVAKESFGLCAAEAMLNGIPVLASNRGALPETVGDAGFVLDIPQRYTPMTLLTPREADVEPWVETILRLWDDPQAYAQASTAARDHAGRWHPDNLAPQYQEFFSNMTHQPGPPLVPKQIYCTTTTPSPS